MNERRKILVNEDDYDDDHTHGSDLGAVFD
jgi:hypothetical protein